MSTNQVGVFLYLFETRMTLHTHPSTKSKKIFSDICPTVIAAWPILSKFKILPLLLAYSLPRFNLRKIYHTVTHWRAIFSVFFVFVAFRYHFRLQFLSSGHWLSFHVSTNQLRPCINCRPITRRCHIKTT